MALLAKEPGLRFGEALLKLGLIDLAGLRHALTRQAKVTIYSLILYPEGRYQIYAGKVHCHQKRASLLKSQL